MFSFHLVLQTAVSLPPEMVMQHKKGPSPSYPLVLKFPENGFQLKHPLTAAQFTIAKCWKQSNCPSVNEWIEKLRHIYTMEY